MAKSIVAALQIGSLPGGKGETLEQILGWECGDAWGLGGGGGVGDRVVMHQSSLARQTLRR